MIRSISIKCWRVVVCSRVFCSTHKAVHFKNWLLFFFPCRQFCINLSWSVEMVAFSKNVWLISVEGSADLLIPPPLRPPFPLPCVHCAVFTLPVSVFSQEACLDEAPWAMKATHSLGRRKQKKKMWGNEHTDRLYAMWGWRIQAALISVFPLIHPLPVSSRKSPPEASATLWNHSLFFPFVWSVQAIFSGSNTHRMCTYLNMAVDIKAVQCLPLAKTVFCLHTLSNSTPLTQSCITIKSAHSH